ncbi:hypothetical protein KDW_01700 [Dictyobacter vulcani]|uniref:Uncharacterized protein n=1 Tax=Dictyobacter vulcani TaxID=2607529 RepID=A0A5J4KBR4_9CHLR|nr:hypothetical protein KDW_01700 [Dictyobacter vulcani]
MTQSTSQQATLAEWYVRLLFYPSIRYLEVGDNHWQYQSGLFMDHNIGECIQTGRGKIDDDEGDITLECQTRKY